MTDSRTLDRSVIQHGIYKCKACQKEYVVNKPDSWDLCTPDFCHECTAAFRKEESDYQDHLFNVGRVGEPGKLDI